MIKQRYPVSTTLLSISLGIFFVILGAQGLAQNSQFGNMANSVANFLGASNEPPFLSVTFFVLEIVAGAILFLAPFGIVTHNVAGIGILVVALLWLAKTILDFFVIGRAFQPNGFDWWRGLSLNLVILISIWHLRPRLDR